MTMEVQIKTKVEHPEQSGAVHEHDSPEVNFGCSTTWFVEGSDGTAMPYYLLPAALGVLIDGARPPGHGRVPERRRAPVHLRRDLGGRHLEPGTTPLKWKLGYGEAAKTDVCSN